MPEISRFFGIVVSMYYNDHGPPHFHARYGGQQVRITIEYLSVLTGSLGPRSLGLVMEWAARHREELKDNWERARRSDPLEPIPPLE